MSDHPHPASRPYARKITARPLADILGKTINDVFARQGFASRELVTRWREIAGAELAAHCEPVKIAWPRPNDNAPDRPQEPATLMLRVSGPMALEIQHASDVLIERVNRFFGWQAIGKIVLRQAPLRHKAPPAAPRRPSAEAIAAIEQTLPARASEDLRAALARLGASLAQRGPDGQIPVKRK